MKIEFGFQSNCSELVTHLGIVNKDEIIAAMDTISKLTNWTWGVMVGRMGVVPILSEKLNGVIIVTDEDIYVNADELISIWTNEMKDSFKEWLRKEANEEWPDLYPILYYGPQDTIINTLPNNYVNFDIDCECGKKGLFLAISSHDINIMPQLHAIRELFNGNYHSYDGGSTSTYLEWMAYHYHSKQQIIEYLIRGYEHDIPKVKKNVSTLETIPPLSPGYILSEEEIEEITRIFSKDKRMPLERIWTDIGYTDIDKIISTLEKIQSELKWV